MGWKLEILKKWINAVSNINSPLDNFFKNIQYNFKKQDVENSWDLNQKCRLLTPRVQ